MSMKKVISLIILLPLFISCENDNDLYAICNDNYCYYDFISFDDPHTDNDVCTYSYIETHVNNILITVDDDKLCKVTATYTGNETFLRWVTSSYEDGTGFNNYYDDFTDMKIYTCCFNIGYETIEGGLHTDNVISLRGDNF